MRRNRNDEAGFKAVALELNLPVSEVRRAVHSFFGEIVSESLSMPFDNMRKIFTREGFRENEVVWNIPSIGRIGPVYSRYLKWRSNEAANIQQVPRDSYRTRYSQDDLEHMAEEILSGRTPSPINKKKGSELYDSVWLVGRDSKKLARQVIPKNKD